MGHVSCADDANIFISWWCKYHKEKKNRHCRVRGFGLEVRTQRKLSKFLYLHHQNAGQNHCMKIANKFLENVIEFKHRRITVEQSVIHGEIKRNIYLENAWYF
jgi:hypothetical protein